MELREQITATTNKKVEAYNGFSKWLFFGGDGVIADNDPEKQEIWWLMPLSSKTWWIRRGFYECSKKRVFR